MLSFSAQAQTIERTLKPCTNPMNCVCTQDGKGLFDPAAISYVGDPQKAMEILLQVLEKNPNAKIIEQDMYYLRIEFVTDVLKYIDDVEFLLDLKEQKIHFRSSSRVGWYDFGANRRRMRKVKKAFWKLHEKNG